MDSPDLQQIFLRTQVGCLSWSLSAAEAGSDRSLKLVQYVRSLQPNWQGSPTSARQLMSFVSTGLYSQVRSKSCHVWLPQWVLIFWHMSLSWHGTRLVTAQSCRTKHLSHNSRICCGTCSETCSLWSSSAAWQGPSCLDGGSPQ